MNWYSDDTLIFECDRYHKWERNDENWNNITHLDPQANYLFKMKNDILELFNGWRLIDYFEFCRYRFNSRPSRWKGLIFLTLCWFAALGLVNIL